MDRQLILCFHGIGQPGRPLEDGEEAVWLAVSQFERILDEVVGVSDVVITFDDGNESDVSVALPLLRERGLTAKFFVVATRIGEAGSLDSSGIQALVRGGMEVGTHGHRHRSWRRLDAPARAEELVEARSMIASVAGRPVTEAAFPFGAYDRGSLRAVRELGYERAYSADGGYARKYAWFQARHSVAHREDAATIRSLVEGLSRRPRPRPVRSAKLLVKRWR